MSKNLIFTESSGSTFKEMASFTIPLMEKYAKKINAGFIYDYKKEKLDYPSYGKFKIKNFLKHYDRVLFLDIDILVKPNSPNIFDVAEEGCYAAFGEGSHCDKNNQLSRLNPIEESSKNFGISREDFEFNKDYFNNSVFIAEQIHEILFEMPENSPHMNDATSEQNLINLRIKLNKFKTFSLPIEFNSMNWSWNKNYLDEGFFIHYAGIPHNERIALIRRDYEIILDKFS